MRASWGGGDEKKDGGERERFKVQGGKRVKWRDETGSGGKTEEEQAACVESGRSRSAGSEVKVAHMHFLCVCENEPEERSLTCKMF